MTPPKAISRRLTLTALCAAGGAGSTGCFGSFGLTKVLYNWNDSFGSKWLKWLLFLVLIIVPVYGIATFVDAVVLNSIEFWFGKHPVSAKRLPEGHRVASKPTEDPNVIRHELYKDDQRIAVLYLEKVNEQEVRLLDERRQVLTQVKLEFDRVALQDSEGAEVASLTPEDCQAIAAAHQQGEPVQEAVYDRLLQSDQLGHVNKTAAALRERLLL